MRQQGLDREYFSFSLREIISALMEIGLDKKKIQKAEVQSDIFGHET